MDSNNNGEKHTIEEREVLGIIDTSILYRFYLLIIIHIYLPIYVCLANIFLSLSSFYFSIHLSLYLSDQSAFLSIHLYIHLSASEWLSFSGKT